ncbi:MAG TPA: glycosyltransferase family A protein [Chitinophagaceae bacterium]
MNPSIFISICIPAYRNAGLLKRLLDSIVIQSYRDFEVIISDDSPDDSIEFLCGSYSDQFLLSYHRNNEPLGTPRNWNEAMRKASGQWIKLMHHDDWFESYNSLQQFADVATTTSEASFIFSAYRNVYDDNRPVKDVMMSRRQLNNISRNPQLLLAKNVIGPPSVVMHKNNKSLQYDEELQWLVDSDFYIRHPGIRNVSYIPDPLICIGVQSSQVTTTAFGNPGIEAPEYMHELNKYGTNILKHIMVFDAYWRMLRNLNIRKADQIRNAGFTGKIGPPVISMISFQRIFPRSVLRFGPLSKMLMFASYLFNRYVKNSFR